jgi:hypothetical protein
LQDDSSSIHLRQIIANFFHKNKKEWVQQQKQIFIYPMSVGNISSSSLSKIVATAGSPSTAMST